MPNAAPAPEIATEPELVPPVPPSASKRWHLLLPVFIFGLALLFRVVGLGWGLMNDLHRQSYHPDEPVVWAYAQQIEPAKLQFTPGFYNYGTFYLTGVKVLTDMTAAYTGAPDPKSPDSVWSFVSRVHYAARFLSALAGAATALVVFLLLRRRTSDFGAAAGGLLIAFAPGHVVHSHFQTVDIFATFLLALSAFFALRLIDSDVHDAKLPNPVRDAALAGLFAGLSAGTKYTGIIALLTVFVALFASRSKDAVKLSLISLVTALVSFLVVTPGAILQSGQFMKDFKYEMTHTATGHGLVFAGTGSGYVYHLANLATGIGGISLLLGLTGLIWLAVRRQVWALALLAFFVPYYVLIGRAEVKFLRYTFPLYVGLAAGFGALVGESRRKGGWGHAVVAVGILGLGGIDSRGLAGSVRASALMAGEDPRDQAVRAVKAKSSDETTVGLAQDPWFWNPPFFPESTAMRSNPFPNRMLEMSQATRPRVTLFIENNGVPSFDSRLVTETKPDYIVITTLENTALERLAGMGTNTPEVAKGETEKYLTFMKALAKDYRSDGIYGESFDRVEDMLYVQPQVLVWKRNEAR